RSFREVMRSVVEDGDIRIVPKRFEKVYFHWIDNLHDWNISRQIWWGHRVPVWYKGDEIYCGVQSPAGKGWEQDPDTLDTWFSSALWTWSTLINPDLADDYSLNLEDLLARSPDFQAYHPTSVLETGWDILFFWVARMILTTTYATGQIPFKVVYLHGLVRTEEGKKMSKSDPDTIIDPLEVIPEYGTDALRLALVSGVSAGNDQRLGKSKIVDNRNFCNKLWNIARYVETVAGSQRPKAEPKSLADHWILNKLSILTGVLEKDLANFRFGEAYQSLYHFVWDDLADWYVEASKSEPNPALLKYVLEATLMVAHPFAPFITETIWQQLGHTDLLAAQLLPKIATADKARAQEFEGLKAGVEEIRRVISDVGANKPKLLYRDSSLIADNAQLIQRLARLGGVSESEGHPNGLRLLSVPGAWLDVNPAAAKNNLKAKLAEAEKAVKFLEGRLANEAYVEKAPEELVADTKAQLAENKQKADQIQKVLKSL
ncbi:MAG TPA: class I tRNA ligase family protein, partial [Candidatus Saccharimonadales bacterium]|nr:class I tRNA ligase family protein [Candidatus Saccharimonadales bacterium]